MRARFAQIVSLIFTTLVPFALFGSAPGAAQQIVGAPPNDAEKTGQKIDAATVDEVLPYGLMSQDVYYDKPTINIPGWTRRENWEEIFDNSSHHKQMKNDAKSVGFYGAIYENNTSREIAIAYRGSVPIFPVKNIDQWVNDWIKMNGAAQFAGKVPLQYAYAAQLAIAAKSVYGKTPAGVTGHSEGGPEATFTAQMVHGIKKVTTFDSASPPILNRPIRDGTTQINVVVSGDTVGDVIGRGNRPGKTVYVDSPTAYQSNEFTKNQGPPQNRGKNYDSLFGTQDNVFAKTQGPPEFGGKIHYTLTGTHDMGGINAGLCAVAMSQLCLQTGPVARVSQPGTSQQQPSSAVPPANSPASITPSTPLFPSSFPASTPHIIQSAPGGISLSKAAAARMPLNIGLDGAYCKDGEVVLSGRYDPRHSLDAALLLTAIRLACESDDPYFSLDPANGAAWSNEGQNASKVLWERIKDGFKWRPAANATRQTKPVLEFRTVSARRDYPVSRILSLRRRDIISKWFFPTCPSPRLRWRSWNSSTRMTKSPTGRLATLPASSPKTS